MLPIPSTWPARANLAQSFPTLREPPLLRFWAQILGSDPGFSSASQIVGLAQRRRSCPAQLLHGPAGIPNLCHVLDLVAIEFHDVDVIRTLEVPARRRSGAPFAGVGAAENAPGGNVLALLVDGERAHFVFAIGKNGQQSLHPIRILLKRFNTHERFGLRRKCSIGSE